MMLQGQLDQPQLQPVLSGMPASDVFANTGLLGNDAAQIPAKITNQGDLWAEYRRPLTSAQPVFKLSLLKRQKFTLEGREGRIAASLAALNAPQPTDLTLAQWKEIVEEVEDED